MKPSTVLVPGFVLLCLACGGASGPAAFSAAGAIDDLEQTAPSPERDRALKAAEKAYAATLTGDAGLMDASTFKSSVEDAVSDGSVSAEEADELTAMATDWPELDADGRATLEVEMEKRRQRRPQIDDLASWDEAELRRRIEAQGVAIESCSHDEVDPPTTEAIRCNIIGSSWGTISWEGFETSSKRREIDAGMVDGGLVVRGHQTHHVVVVLSETARARSTLENWLAQGEPKIARSWLTAAAKGWTVKDCMPSVPGFPTLNCDLENGEDRANIMVIERPSQMPTGWVDSSLTMFVTEQHSVTLALYGTEHQSAFVDGLVKP